MKIIFSHTTNLQKLVFYQIGYIIYSNIGGNFMSKAKNNYKKELYNLWVELVKFQNTLIKKEEKVLLILEGRDSAGKDGMIRTIARHLSPRETRVFAVSKPTDKEKKEWYFQRFVPHLPAPSEFVLFNRSWYNRAGVERVMGFCTKKEYEQFYEDVIYFENLLLNAGIKMFKFYLDIDKKEQEKRLESRKKDPLKQWKESPVDDVAIKHFDDYTQARNEMFERTHTPQSPWIIVNANDKHNARLNLIKYFLLNVDYKDKNEKILNVDPNIVVVYNKNFLSNN